MSEHAAAVTRALVLAAGRGSRLDHSSPKPTFELLGVPLLARTLFTLEKAGITDAWVVLGYEADRVRRGMEEATERLDLRVHWLYNDEWRKRNGVSVLAGEPVLDGPFVLAMSDHVFDAGIVRSLMEGWHGDSALDLAVDPDVGRILDLDDATKVRVEAGRIADIGKSLGDYDAVDTGVFLASPALFRALRECESSDDGPSLSDGVRRLAGEGRARAVDVEGRTWHDVDTPEDVEAAEEKLLEGLRKETDGPVSRHLNRPVSLAVSRRLVKTPVTPNQVSVGTLGIGLVSAASAALGGYVGFLVSGILFQLASILDGTDGEIAKLKFRTSVRGEWIDTVCDNLSYLAFLAGVIVGVHRSDLPGFYVTAGVVGLVSTALSLANIHFYLLREDGSGSALAVRYSYQEGTGVGSRILGVLHYLGKRDVLAFLVLVLAAVGRLPVALPLFGVGVTVLLLPATLQANLRSWRQARSRSESTSSSRWREAVGDPGD